MLSERPTMLLVFGAGASKDSISVAGGTLDARYRPPVADELLSRESSLQGYMAGRGATKSLAATVFPKLGIEGDRRR